MAASTFPKSYRDGTLVITDGAALTHTVDLMKEGLTIEGLTPGNRELKYLLIRGTDVRTYPGDRQIQKVSFSVHMAEVADNTNVSILQVLTRAGAWAAATSTRPETHAALFCVNITWTIEGTDYGDASDHVFFMNDFHLMSAGVTEGDPNELRFEGLILGDFTLT